MVAVGVVILYSSSVGGGVVAVGVVILYSSSGSSRSGNTV